jgi:hypothetical protein
MRFLLCLLPLCLPVRATPVKKLAVFVGLCDNASQGIVKVGAKIGDGDKPDDNLYWGCDDGLRSCFKRSPKWKLEARETRTGDPRILERLTFRHTDPDAILIAEAWRGSNLRDCIVAFESAAVSGDHDLVAFIGHNGLIDEPIAPPDKTTEAATDAIVLCCLSDRFFRPRLEKLGVRPVLTTAQLMYPGSFILHDATETWLRGGSPAQLREAAANAYAKNQKIRVKYARGVFARPD